MLKSSKTLIRIQLIDLLKAPLPNVYHVIREGGTVISEGSTDSNGCGVWIRRSIGTTLNIAIKDPKTKTMMSLPPVTVAKPKNGSNGTTVRLQAAYYKQSIRLLERQGNQGDYRRKTHSVKRGETLESIAKQYGTTWQILQQLNKDKISNPDRIQVGWQLKVPPKHSGLRNMGQGSTPPKSTPKPSTAKITTANYQVQAGDTLGSIAQRCGKSIADLQRLNGIYDPNKIKVGQNLKTGLPNYPVSQPKPQTTKSLPSTTEKNGGILDSMADAVNRAGQAIDSGVEALKDAVSDLFNSDDKQATPPAKPTSKSTSTSKPKSTPTKITTTSQRSGNEDGTPKEVVERLKSPIIFPLLEQPVNDPGKPYAGFDWRKKLGEKGASQAVFGVNRSQGGRKHAGRDLYTRVQNADKNAKTGGVVVSIAPGKILAVKNFYNGTDQVTISHVTEDGRKFIVRYGELDTKSVQQLKNRIGGSISQGEILGVTGILRANDNESGPPMSFSAVGGKNISMLHFEYFTGKGHSLDRADNLSSKSGVYKRRSDLADPLEILLEGYSATFLKPLPATNYKMTNKKIFSESDARDALIKIIQEYGRDIAVIIEKMYRAETRHFDSTQYKYCGTPGMEAHGEPPYYGWDSRLFISPPTGIWSAYENAGLSQQGGNAQITSSKKRFVCVDSVFVGMSYLAKYIKKHHGNYARWYSTDSKNQQIYRDKLSQIRARIVNQIQ